MEQRRLGRSGLAVPVLSLGTATFGGGDAFFAAWGGLDLTRAERLVDLCLDHGANMFDCADAYSGGLAEEILGQALRGRRNRALISTKAALPVGDPSSFGASRHHVKTAVEGSLRRLGVDRIDLFQLHAQDLDTDLRETLETLDDLVRQGKVGAVGCSNFSGWRLMKSLAIADQQGLPRYQAHQVYYSLLHRDYEFELMDLALEEQVSALVWSPLSWGRLAGKVGRDRPAAPGTRAHDAADAAPSCEPEHLFVVLDVIEMVARNAGRTMSQVALNWLLRRPTVASVIVGARDEQQLVDNLSAGDWALSAEQIAVLDRASAASRPYPAWHQAQFPMLRRGFDEALRCASA